MASDQLENHSKGTPKTAFENFGPSSSEVFVDQVHRQGIAVVEELHMVGMPCFPNVTYHSCRHCHDIQQKTVGYVV